uniref:C-JID domain-containing protein n=1 Tax=Fagus sylvatica TaxID=28930 RepID=A0A2N9G7T4_FAGSY
MERVCKLYLDGTAITKLPTSIEHLTGLASLSLKDCKSLVCLPSTIFNFKFLKDVDISGCSKLDRLPENMGNAENVEELNVSGTAIRQGPSPQYPRHRYDIVIPGSEIPEWFSHQSLGDKVNIKEPYSHLCNELMGIAVCVVFCSQEHHPHHQINYNDGLLACWMMANGEPISIPQGTRETQKAISIRLEIKISTHKFKHQGKEMRAPHAVVVEGNKVKRSRDDNDGAGPSGEGSSNDVPHPKRIQRLTESMTHGNSNREDSSDST